MRRACTRVQTTTDSPDSTALDASQSNRTLTNSLTWYQACLYERRFVALPPSIIHAQCQSLRTHNVQDHRAGVDVTERSEPTRVFTLRCIRLLDSVFHPADCGTKLRSGPEGKMRTINRSESGCRLIRWRLLRHEAMDPKVVFRLLRLHRKLRPLSHLDVVPA